VFEERGLVGDVNVLLGVMMVEGWPPLKLGVALPLELELTPASARRRGGGLVGRCLHEGEGTEDGSVVRSG
jgi:hypothetical protein